MSTIKETFKAVGYVALGLLSLATLVVVLLWQILEAMGRAIIWVADKKLQEKDENK